MLNGIRRWPFLTAGFLLSPIILVVGFMSAGAGHGSYVAARIVLPFACLAMGSYLGAETVVSLLAVLQWPIYGILVDISSRKALTCIAVLMLHSALSLWLFTNLWVQFR
jgi:hypothetical protein